MENRDVINRWLKSKQQGPPWFAPGAFTAGWRRSIRLGFSVYTICVQGRVVDLYFTHDGEFIGIDYFNEADQDSDNTIHTDDAVKAYGRTRVAPTPDFIDRDFSETTQIVDPLVGRLYTKEGWEEKRRRVLATELPGAPAPNAPSSRPEDTGETKQKPSGHGDGKAGDDLLELMPSSQVPANLWKLKKDLMT